MKMNAKIEFRRAPWFISAAIVPLVFLAVQQGLVAMAGISEPDLTRHAAHNQVDNGLPPLSSLLSIGIIVAILPTMASLVALGLLQFYWRNPESIPWSLDWILRRSLPLFLCFGVFLFAFLVAFAFHLMM